VILEAAAEDALAGGVKRRRDRLARVGRELAAFEKERECLRNRCR